MDQEWLSAPIGIDAYRWISRVGCRTVLVAVHSLVSCHRLLDVVDLVESDPRVQVVFTVAPDVFATGLGEYLHELGALVVPWRQAVLERFDLALAASYGGIHELHAPLAVMAHGAGSSPSAQVIASVARSSPTRNSRSCRRVIRAVVSLRSARASGSETGSTWCGRA